MKQIFMYTLLATVLGSTHLMAQPSDGQFYGTLRSISISNQSITQQNQLTLLQNVQQYTEFNMHLQAGKMISERTSIGLGLITGYVFQESFGDVRNAPRLGISGFGRKWFPIYKSFTAHIDLQASYSHQWGVSGLLSESHNIDLGLMPGVSWFFHPKWALEGRISGAQLNYRKSETAFPANNVEKGHQFNMSYNVNPLNMQFAISRFF